MSTSSNNTSSPDNNNMTLASSQSPLLLALRQHRVIAQVYDVDHYRMRGGMAVETDYILRVASSSSTSSSSNQSSPSKAQDFQVIDDDFDLQPFYLSKTYASFRQLAQQLQHVATAHRAEHTMYASAIPTKDKALLKYCELVHHLIESQRTQYLGKVNFTYVKGLAAQRQTLLQQVMDATTKYFPVQLDTTVAQQVASMLETFFLTDHCPAGAADRKGHKHTMSTDRGIKTVNHLAFAPGTKPTLDLHTHLLNPLSWLTTQQQQQVINPDGGTGGTDAGNTATTTAALRITTTKPLQDVADNQQHYRHSVVVPMTYKSRPSLTQRERETAQLQQVGAQAQLWLDDDRTVETLMPHAANDNAGMLGASMTARCTAVISHWIQQHRVWFAAILLAGLAALRQLSLRQIVLDADHAVLALFAAYCLGLHTPRVDLTTMASSARGGRNDGRAPTPRRKTEGPIDRSGRQLLRRSMAFSPRNTGYKVELSGDHGGDNQNDDSAADKNQEDAASVDDASSGDGGGGAELQSPLPRFPDDAKIGSHHNCWSDPDPGNFQVRGPKYFNDKKKVASGEFLFAIRGVDLFLTDTCPENVGRNNSVLGGRLREAPTFIINFRLPWGVLLFYFEIAEQFVPFVRAGYEKDFDKSKLPNMKTMEPGERTACRFLLKSNEDKNKVFKIVPSVCDGPWIVRSVVGGKPALVGNKLPINYVYQPAKDGKQLYLEADLDIAASSAARGILSVARTYTQDLTLDMGFVVQANEQDELPEQMLVGCRIHGIDPLSCPTLPPMDDDVFLQDDNAGTSSASDDDSMTPEA